MTLEVLNSATEIPATVPQKISIDDLKADTPKRAASTIQVIKHHGR
jgi:hypothetical protein